MLDGTETWRIIELINHIRKNELAQFDWMYKELLKELCVRQPYLAKVYMYRDLFEDKAVS